MLIEISHSVDGEHPEVEYPRALQPLRPLDSLGRTFLASGEGGRVGEGEGGRMGGRRLVGPRKTKELCVARKGVKGKHQPVENTHTHTHARTHTHKQRARMCALTWQEWRFLCHLRWSVPTAQMEASDNMYTQLIGNLGLEGDWYTGYAHTVKTPPPPRGEVGSAVFWSGVGFYSFAEVVAKQQKLPQRSRHIQCSRLNLSHFLFFLKMVMPNQHSQRLESIFLCTTQATPTGQ